MMGKTIQLNFKYVKPSLIKGPFRHNKNKLSTSDDDVPDLASTSCASADQEINSKKQQQVPQQQMLECDVSESQHHEDHPDENDDDFLPPCLPLEDTDAEPDTNSTSDLLSAVLKQHQESSSGIVADREQRLVVKNCIPTNIVLLPDFDDEDSDSNSDADSTSSKSLQERLEHAQALIHSYQDTIRSNEHLIDSLHKTITKTQEQALNVMSSHQELEEAVQLLLQERDEEDEDMVTEPKIFLKMAMATSLLLYFFGITTEYPLIAAVMVYLLEGLL